MVLNQFCPNVILTRLVTSSCRSSCDILDKLLMKFFDASNTLMTFSSAPEAKLYLETCDIINQSITSRVTSITNQYNKSRDIINQSI